MKSSRSSLLAIVLANVLVIVLGSWLASPVLAHWCHDNWGSSYNIVVRPASDTVDVPESGSATLDLWVQNNTGEPLLNFALTATASGYEIAVSRDAPKVSGYLMPGERLKHTLTISRDTGGATLTVEAITFSVSFGTGEQSSIYGAEGRDVVVRKAADGSLIPAKPFPGLGEGNGQALHLRRAAIADYGNTDTGLNELLQEYCAGRASWDHGSELVTTSFCPNTSTTVCPPTAPAYAGTKWDYQKLWAAQELASRRSALGARRDVFLARLVCGWNDPNLTFWTFSGFLMGYVGLDDTTRSFLQGRVAAGSADEKAIAKAALLLGGDSSQHDDVVANMESGNFHLSVVSAGAVAIVDKDDSAVEQRLLPRSRWICPTSNCGASADNGNALLAAHVVALVAWDRRGWAPNAGDTGTVSFYGEEQADETPPSSPGGVACSTTPGGTVQVRWRQVTTDVDGGAETVAQYRVYSGNEPRTAGCVAPGCATDYTHVDTSSGSYRDFPSLDGEEDYYFAVIAVDASGNPSAYSEEVHCVPQYAPVAVIRCEPENGEAPLAVTCYSDASTDENGTADIATRSFSLDGETPQEASEVSYRFDDAGGYTVVLRVTDKTGLFDTDQAYLTATAGGNSPPTARAEATPSTGQAPLEVHFSSAGTSDSDDGQSLSCLWDFDDGSTSTEQHPVHTFQSAGGYDVTLKVTDNGSPPLSSTAVAAVEVLGNRPPDLAAASATPLFGPVPLTVQLDATGVVDPDGNSIAFTWSFGDGPTTANGSTAEHTYSTEGTYIAELSAQDDGTPAIPAATRTFTINAGGGPPENHPPDCAQASVSPLSGKAPLVVSLDASKCSDPDGDELAFRWRIPTSLTEEETIETAAGQYTFSESGQVTIRLEVTDDGTKPMQTNREFVVSVEEGGEGSREVAGGCGCTVARRARARDLAPPPQAPRR
ncbi:MAG: PKD domain-containing protein [Pseudomonadota bacterium]